MLEGQVAILSSGMLSGEESRLLLESLRQSKLYRPDQHSYILYPDRDLPGFLEKNCLLPDQVKELQLVTELVQANDKSLIVRSADGNYRFSGHLRNARDVNRALDTLPSQYAEWVEHERGKIMALFEATFRHNEFTGRSGTFFAYEGLGSIYWHMVSKLLLAVQETLIRTRAESATAVLKEMYTDIRKGLSFNKPPHVYGAFPTDPYSHTPKGQGAKQPGMTGLVKEEILTRQRELGCSLEKGRLAFDFLLLDQDEFLAEPSKFLYRNLDEQQAEIELPARSIAYSICQVPVILLSSDQPRIEVHFSNGSLQQIEGSVLDIANSRHIFQRDGVIHHLVVSAALNK
jgi:hypothetical protein